MTLWSKLKICAVVAAVLVISGLALYSRSLAGANSTLSQTNRQLQANIISLEASLLANTQALLAREVIVARLNDEQNLTLEEMEVIYETDKSAADWASTALPDAVYNGLLR